MHEWQYKSEVTLREVETIIQALKRQTKDSKLYNGCLAEMTAITNADSTGEDTQYQSVEAKRQAMFDKYMGTVGIEDEPGKAEWSHPPTGSEYVREEEGHMLLLKQMDETHEAAASKKPSWRERVLAHNLLRR